MFMLDRSACGFLHILDWAPELAVQPRWLCGVRGNLRGPLGSLEDPHIHCIVELQTQRWTGHCGTSNSAETTSSARSNKTQALQSQSRYIRPHSVSRQPRPQEPVYNGCIGCVCCTHGVSIGLASARTGPPQAGKRRD